MGASTKTLSRLADLAAKGHLGAGSKMLELGTQNLFCVSGGPDLAEFLESVNGKPSDLSEGELNTLANGGLMAHVMRLCGVDYLALDISDYEATMLFDLNVDTTPPDMVGQYDLVTNFGTTEHLIGQHNAMKVIHEFTKVGGIIYHDIPLGGYFNHGYFSYNPLFFNHLAAANDYEILFRHFSKLPARSPYTQKTSKEMRANGWPDAGYHDAGIEFIFRKTTDAPFQVPIEVYTSHAVNQEFMESRGNGSKILSGTNLADTTDKMSDR